MGTLQPGLFGVIVQLYAEQEVRQGLGSVTTLNLSMVVIVVPGRLVKLKIVIFSIVQVGTNNR